MPSCQNTQPHLSAESKWRENGASSSPNAAQIEQAAILRAYPSSWTVIPERLPGWEKNKMVAVLAGGLGKPAHSPATFWVKKQVPARMGDSHKRVGPRFAASCLCLLGSSGCARLAGGDQHTHIHSLQAPIKG